MPDRKPQWGLFMGKSLLRKLWRFGLEGWRSGLLRSVTSTDGEIKNVIDIGLLFLNC